MSSSPPPFEMDNHSLLVHCIRFYFKALLRRCSRPSSEFSAVEMHVQDIELAYLDLELPSPRLIRWERYARTLFNNNLPLMTREFLLAERLDEGHQLNQTYHEFLQSNVDRMYAFFDHQNRRNLRLLSDFEDKIFTDIWSKSSEEKKLIVLKCLRAYDVLEFDRFVAMYRFLLQVITNPPLDCELTVHVFRAMCDTDNKKRMALQMASDVWSLEALICHARDMRFDFWGMWNGTALFVQPFDFHHSSIYIPVDQDCRRLLLQYGFPYLVNPDEFRRRCVYLLNLVFDERRVVRTVDPIIEEAVGGEKMKMTLMMDTFIVFGDFDFFDDMDNKIKTLVYITRTLPYPYLTPSELYGTMKKVVAPSYIPHLQALVHNYATADIFETEHEERSPRRLMHLCRIVIRERLAENFKLLDGLGDECFPPGLKRYLALEE